MASDCERIASYVILGRTFLDTVPYDAKAAVVLLSSVAAVLSGAAPGFLGSALYLYTIAALGDNEVANRDARSSIRRVIDTLERRLASAASA